MNDITIERVGDVYTIKIGNSVSGADVEIPNVTWYNLETSANGQLELNIQIKIQNPIVICEISIPEAEHEMGK